MFWCSETPVEFDLVQHQIIFAGSSYVRLSTHHHKSDVGLSLIQEVLNVKTAFVCCFKKEIQIWPKLNAQTFIAMYSLFSSVMCISIFHLSNLRGLCPCISNESCES